MSYQTGSVVSFAALKSEILSFLVANSWVQEVDIIKKNGVFAKLATGNYAINSGNYLDLKGGTGSDGLGNLLGEPVNNYNYQAQRMATFLGQDNADGIAWPATYRFFLGTDPDYFWCILEYNGSFIQWMGFGNIEKSATFTGGDFYCASCNGRDSNSLNEWLVVTGPDMMIADGQGSSFNSYPVMPFRSQSRSSGNNHHTGQILHAEIGGLDWYHAVRDANYYTPPGQWMMKSHRFIAEEVQSAELSVNNMPSLIPIRLFVRGLDLNWQRIGRLPGLRMTRISSINLAQIESDGTDSWMFFPCFKKDASEPNGGTNHSGTYGMAMLYDGP